MDYFHLSAPKQDLLNMSSLGFAYLGDAVYEVMVRAPLCLHGKLTPGRQHKAALAYVAAPRQAALLERILPLLTQEEAQVLKRGRNASPHSYPRGLPARSTWRPQDWRPCSAGSTSGGDRPAQYTL